MTHLDEAADLQRRFGGLERLYGMDGAAAIRRAHVAVVGIGGVGSWAAEALARSGVGQLTLIDLDHVAESNINRQVQAVGATVGQAKGLALQERIADIHPGCAVHLVDDFVSPDNWPGLLTQPIDVLVDACDQVSAKVAMAGWALAHRVPFVTVGAAGGKRRPQAVEVEDLSATTHDPLLASMRQRLRKQHGAARTGTIGVRCVFSREAVRGEKVDLVAAVRERLAAMQLVACRMAHERVCEVSDGVVRQPLCSKETRARRLACGHTMARDRLARQQRGAADARRAAAAEVVLALGGVVVVPRDGRGVATVLGDHEPVEGARARLAEIIRSVVNCVLRVVFVMGVQDGKKISGY